jgi:hypothetical protein
MPKSKTAQRGYGAHHQQVRRTWAPRVATGHIDCYRCGHPIQPGTPWDLGHTTDRTDHTGPEHRHCNRSEGATRGNRMRTPPTTPQTW